MALPLFFIGLLIPLWGHGHAVCDEETLLRFQARTQCWYSNNERTCSSLPFLGGTAGAAMLAAKANQSLGFAKLKNFMDILKLTSVTLARDYKAMLKTYYDLKKNSPQPAFEKPLQEFTFEEFKKFEAPLLKAHPKNLYIQKLLEYGKHGDNDVFARTTGYARSQEPTHIGKIMKTHYASQLLDLNRAKMIFREVSVANGYPQNGDPAFGSRAGRLRTKENLRARQNAIQTELGAEKKLGSQLGKATIGALSGLATVAAGLIPVVDLGLKRGAIMNCANEFGLKLDEGEAIKLARTIDLEALSLTTKSPCEKMIFTEQGVASLLDDANLTNNVKNFMCKYEGLLAPKQDVVDQDIYWKAEGCATSETQKSGTIGANLKKDRAVITTRSGAEVEIKWNQYGEWDYSTLKSINDVSLAGYIKDKVQHPLNIRSLTSQYMNPRTLCTSHDPTQDAQNLCDVARAMRTFSQVRSLVLETCSESNAERHENNSIGSTQKNFPKKGEQQPKVPASVNSRN